jgi:hypothetical protein
VRHDGLWSPGSSWPGLTRGGQPQQLEEEVCPDWLLQRAAWWLAGDGYVVAEE